MRGLRDDALLSLVERERRRQEKIRRKLDGGCVSENAGVKSRGSAASDSKLLSESSCAWKARGEHRVFVPSI